MQHITMNDILKLHATDFMVLLKDINTNYLEGRELEDEDEKKK